MAYKRQTDRGRERGGKGERVKVRGERKRRLDYYFFLLSGLRPITTGVNIQAIRILMDPTTDLNSVF